MKRRWCGVIALAISSAASQALQDRGNAGIMSNVWCSIDNQFRLLGPRFECRIVSEIANNSLNSWVFGFQSLCFLLAANEYLNCRERVLRVNQIQDSTANVPSAADTEFQLSISRSNPGLPPVEFTHRKNLAIVSGVRYPVIVF